MTKRNGIGRQLGIVFGALLLVLMGCGVAVARIDVQPPRFIPGQPVAIHLSDLPNAEITVHVISRLINGLPSHAWAVFRPEHGAIDPARMAPLAGSYQGVDPAGLFWSQRSTTLSGRPKELIELARETEGDKLTIALEIDGAIVETARLSYYRSYGTDGFDREEIFEDGIHGTLFRAAKPPRRPTILFIGGNPFAVSRFMADRLNDAGYNVFWLNYHVFSNREDCLANVPVEYFERAVSWLRDQPWVVPDRIGMIGLSLGGQATLLALSHSALPVAAAVAINAPYWNTQGGCVAPDAAFTEDGVKVPYINLLQHDGPTEATGVASYLVPDQQPQRVIFDRALVEEGSAVQTLVSVPVERIRTPTLLIGAERDELVPSAAGVREMCARAGCGGNSALSARITEGGHKTFATGWTPFSCWSTADLPPGPIPLGGTCEVNAKVQRENLSAVLQFLAKYLGG